MKKVLLSKAIHPEAMKLLQGKVDLLVLPDSTAETATKMVADVDGVVLRTNINFTLGAHRGSVQMQDHLANRSGGRQRRCSRRFGKRHHGLQHPWGEHNLGGRADHRAHARAGKAAYGHGQGGPAGNWKIRNANKSVDVEGKTLGLVGVGRIGSEVARKCREAFSMKAIAFDPFVKQADGIRMCASLEEVFREADFLSIHVPYTEQTHHLVNERLIGLMKPDACLLNTSRGAVMDEAALAQALSKGSIAGAGLDVLEDEPPAAANPLFKLENVILTPHSAALSRECEMKVAIEAAQAIVDFAAGRQP